MGHLTVMRENFLLGRKKIQQHQEMITGEGPQQLWRSNNDPRAPAKRERTEDPGEDVKLTLIWTVEHYEKKTSIDYRI